jgi:hypothetical protein
MKWFKPKKEPSVIANIINEAMAKDEPPPDTTPVSSEEAVRLIETAVLAVPLSAWEFCGHKNEDWFMADVNYRGFRLPLLVPSCLYLNPTQALYKGCAIKHTPPIAQLFANLSAWHEEGVQERQRGFWVDSAVELREIVRAGEEAARNTRWH